MESALTIGTCSALCVSLCPGAALIVLIIICCVIFYTVEVSANAAPKDDEPPRAVSVVELDVALAATKENVEGNTARRDRVRAVRSRFSLLFL